MQQREVIPGAAAVVPAPRGAADGGPECAAVAYVDGLDGSERTVLLRMIATAYPGVVEAGAGLVEQWRAECAEHRKERAKRMRNEQRRRQRARTGETWPPRR